MTEERIEEAKENRSESREKRKEESKREKREETGSLKPSWGSLGVIGDRLGALGRVFSGRWAILGNLGGIFGLKNGTPRRYKTTILNMNKQPLCHRLGIILGQFGVVQGSVLEKGSSKTHGEMFVIVETSVLMKIRLREATGAKFGSTWVPPKLQNDHRGR